MITWKDGVPLDEKRVQQIMNPTGGKHTPTPWKKGADGDAPAILAGDSGFMLAAFTREADRDLALYFANAHAGMIGLFRNMADQFEFVARVTADDGLRLFAEGRAQEARIYADLFCRLGKPEVPQQEEGKGQ
jgi:hypothetical protein